MAKKRASKWNIHVRNVGRVLKAHGVPFKHAMGVAKRSYSKATGSVASNWKAQALSAAKRLGGKSSSKSSKRGKSRKGSRGGANLDSFSGLDNFLSRLVGGVKKALKMRPSESLAQRKAKLQDLIGKMDRGISALKEREQLEDMTRAQYNAHLAELKRLKAAQDALKKAWKEAHRKTKAEDETWTGPGDFGGFYASGDPSRRKRKKKAPKRKSAKRRPAKSGSARKRTSGRRRVSATTRAKMSRAAKRRWATIRSKKRSARKSPKRKGAKRDPKRRKKARRDWSGDFGGDSF